MNPVPTRNIGLSKAVIDDFVYCDDNVDESTPNSPIFVSGSNSEVPSPQSVSSPDTTLDFQTPTLPRRSTRTHRAPNWHNDFVTNNVSYISNLAYTDIAPEFHCLLDNLTTNPDPLHFKTAVLYDHWIQAMNLELEALEQNQTREVTTLPPNKTAIVCKWIYKSKYNPDGTLERHKARLVILGCRQKAGVDYDQTFAPVAKLTTVRTLLAVASTELGNLSNGRG